MRACRMVLDVVADPGFPYMGHGTMDGQLIVMEIRRPRRLALLDDVPWYV